MMSGIDDIVILLATANLIWILTGITLMIVGAIVPADALTGPIFDLRNLGSAWKTAGALLGITDLVAVANFLEDVF
jgi:hypothetical protein